MLFVKDKIVIPAVVFVRPHFQIYIAVVCGYGAPLAAGCNNFILAERPCPNIADRTYRPAFIYGSVRLRAILYNP